MMSLLNGACFVLLPQLQRCQPYGLCDPIPFVCFVCFVVEIRPGLAVVLERKS